jgi:hypothetical protein
MRRCLIVAHKTLGGSALLDEVRRRREDGELAVHLLVPVDHPVGAWTDGQLDRAAEAVLQTGLARMKELDVEATGEVGDANPVYAVEQVCIRGEQFDEIIVSTLPHGISKWLKSDAPSRLAKRYRVPVTHIIGARESVDAN